MREENDRTVFQKLVEEILYNTDGFAEAVLGDSAEDRKVRLEAFLGEFYVDEELVHKQVETLDSFIQVLAKTDLGMIEELRQVVNREPYPFLPI